LKVNSNKSIPIQVTSRYSYLIIKSLYLSIQLLYRNWCYSCWWTSSFYFLSHKREWCPPLHQAKKMYLSFLWNRKKR